MAVSEPNIPAADNASGDGCPCRGATRLQAVTPVFIDSSLRGCGSGWSRCWFMWCMTVEIVTAAQPPHQLRTVRVQYRCTPSQEYFPKNQWSIAFTDIRRARRRTRSPPVISVKSHTRSAIRRPEPEVERMTSVAGERGFESPLRCRTRASTPRRCATGSASPARAASAPRTVARHLKEDLGRRLGDVPRCRLTVVSPACGGGDAMARLHRAVR